MELRGRVEALQVHWSLWGVCTLIDDQRSQDQVCKCGMSGTRDVPIEVFSGS